MGTVGTRWYTLAEAAPILGISVDTVRRRLKRGELEARQVRTQHGPTWEVCLGSLQGEPAPVAEGAAQGAQGDAGGDRSQALAAWAASLLAPIAAELGAARETIERQAGELGDLRETVGRLGAERDAAVQSADLFRRRNDGLLAGALTVLVIVLLVAAVGWVS